MVGALITLGCQIREVCPSESPDEFWRGFPGEYFLEAKNPPKHTQQNISDQQLGAPRSKSTLQGVFLGEFIRGWRKHGKGIGRT